MVARGYGERESKEHMRQGGRFGYRWCRQNRWNSAARWGEGVASDCKVELEVQGGGCQVVTPFEGLVGM